MWINKDYSAQEILMVSPWWVSHLNKVMMQEKLVLFENNRPCFWVSYKFLWNWNSSWCKNRVSDLPRQYSYLQASCDIGFLLFDHHILLIWYHLTILCFKTRKKTVPKSNNVSSIVKDLFCLSHWKTWTTHSALVYLKKILLLV